EDVVPPAVARLPEQAQGRVPRGIFALQHPAPLALGAAEQPHRFAERAGEMRHRGGRTEEREAALRPTAAAALVYLAGKPGGTLVDPCCGSGTVLTEAMAAGWQAAGGDFDPSALESAAANLRSRHGLWHGDARKLPFADGSIGAVATNLPFGHQCKLPSQPRPWLTAVLSESARVTGGGPVVVLCPQSKDLGAAVAAAGLSVRRSVDIRLLGHRTTLSCLSAP
ncbi:MAG: methyltransferase domain-containing protein, partial [Actinobacteria bacterium]|nr:methyltransferase domain-containing protein [Actinomycetota bacterium]